MNWRKVLTWEINIEKLKVGDVVEITDTDALADLNSLDLRSRAMLWNGRQFTVKHAQYYQQQWPGVSLRLQPLQPGGQKPVDLYCHHGWERYFRKVA